MKERLLKTPNDWEKMYTLLWLGDNIDWAKVEQVNVMVKTWSWYRERSLHRCNPHNRQKWTRLAEEYAAAANGIATYLHKELIWSKLSGK